MFQNCLLLTLSGNCEFSSIWTIISHPTFKVLTLNAEQSYPPASNQTKVKSVSLFFFFKLYHSSKEVFSNKVAAKQMRQAI